MEEEFMTALEEILKEDQILTEESMSRHTTFRVGGPAQYYLKPKAGQVCGIRNVCRRYGVPYMIIGNGSNMLVSDQGIRGAVIEIGRNMDQVTVTDQVRDGKKVLVAEAGALLSKAAKVAMESSLSGMERICGIPGCVGGAVTMNAGAYEAEIKNVLGRVWVATKDGEEKILSPEQLDLSYRHSNITQQEYIVLKVEFLLEDGEKEQINDRMKDFNGRRMSKQPLEYPSAGSTFKRPAGFFAGKLIQDSGLAGFQIGGAKVSEKHCGFIINEDHATASDVEQVIRHVQTVVKEKFDVELEPEVKMLGQW